MQALFVHGTFTPGIFRKPANEKRKRELQELLDSGEEYNLDDVPVLVLSSTLKVNINTVVHLLFSNIYFKY